MTVQIIVGDCRDVLATLPAQSVHCVVTSPPYWGLRDYGTAKWEGGDSDCTHVNGRPGSDRADGIVQMVSHRNRDGAGAFSGDCRKCGARRIDSQIGLETGYGDYVDRMVEVFDSVRRVLRVDGTVWLNLGDSYNGYMANQRATSISANNQHARPLFESGRGRRDGSLKAKDLVGIPWRVAFALQADGWYLRQDIIWSKPNPMPESVTDRCTKAHEYLFLLSKSERYYYDAEAIAETSVVGIRNRTKYDGESAVDAKTRGFDNQCGSDGSRNKRSVWEITTQPFPEAHFATFPPALIEPCILAGCPKGGTVLDPFAGAGTTGLVADRLGRNATLIELNPEYAAMAERRIKGDAPLFTDVRQKGRRAPCTAQSPTDIVPPKPTA